MTIVLITAVIVVNDYYWEIKNKNNNNNNYRYMCEFSFELLVLIERQNY